jgi:hypothetical protein
VALGPLASKISASTPLCVFVANVDLYSALKPSLETSKFYPELKLRQKQIGVIPPHIFLKQSMGRFMDYTNHIWLYIN